jgi:hypothetical protein
MNLRERMLKALNQKTQITKKASDTHLKQRQSEAAQAIVFLESMISEYGIVSDNDDEFGKVKVEELKKVIEQIEDFYSL